MLIHSEGEKRAPPSLERTPALRGRGESEPSHSCRDGDEGTGATGKRGECNGRARRWRRIKRSFGDVNEAVISIPLLNSRGSCILYRKTKKNPPPSEKLQSARGGKDIRS
jgi:hypothetical protein